MEPQSAFDAHRAWKLAFAPYLSQADGALAAVRAAPEQPAVAPVCGRVIALPVIVNACDKSRRLCTRATAVLIRGETGDEPGNLLRRAVQPLPPGTARTAILSVTALTGRFSA